MKLTSFKLNSNQPEGGDEEKYWPQFLAISVGMFDSICNLGD